MPTITLSRKELQKTLKKKRTDEELKNAISFLGTDLESIDGDDINVEIFPNRPDLLSQQGFNRAMAAFLGDTTGLVKYKTKKATQDTVVKIEEAVSKVRPYTACALIKGLKLNDERIKEIIQIQEKLHITYGRNRKRCAIGVYPLEAITLPITYTAKKPQDIVFEPLEGGKEMNGLEILQKHPTGRDYAHLLENEKLYPVFIDAKGEVLSMPPIINSEKTGRITTKTTDVFVECSGHRYDVVHAALAMLASSLAQMQGTIQEMTLVYPEALGGQRTSPDLNAEEMPLELNYVHKYIGYPLDEKDIKNCLGRMGIDVSVAKKKDTVIAHIPKWRVDVLHPIDLIEDIAIGYGMDNIQATIPNVATIGQERKLNRFASKLREILSGAGLLEVKNYNLTSKENQLIEHEEEELVQVASSASQEYDTLRKTLLPTGLATLARNKHHEYPQKIYEVGEVFKKDKNADTGVCEGLHLSILLCAEDADYTKIRQHLDLIFEALAQEAIVVAEEDRLFIKGRSAVAYNAQTRIGRIGEITPSVLQQCSLEMPVAALEIDLEALYRSIGEK